MSLSAQRKIMTHRINNFKFIGDEEASINWDEYESNRQDRQLFSEILSNQKAMILQIKLLQKQIENLKPQQN